MDRDLIKECIYQHWINESKPPVVKSGVIKYGAYAEQTSWQNINMCLWSGGRGLPGGESLAVLKAEVAAEHGFEYKSQKKSENSEGSAPTAAL